MPLPPAAVTLHGGTAPPHVHAVRLLQRPSVATDDNVTSTFIFSDAAARKALLKLPRYAVQQLAADVPERVSYAAGDWAACQLERPVYAPGDVVRGQVVVRAVARRRVRFVALHVACAETALLCFSVDTSQQGASTATYYTHGAHVQRIDQHLRVAESEVQLEPGFNLFPFAFRLPESAPGSTYSRYANKDEEKYNNSLAHIEYTLTASFGQGAEALKASQGLLVQGVPARAAAAVPVSNGSSTEDRRSGGGGSGGGGGGGRGGGGSPTAHVEAPVTVCCCLGRGRVGVSLEVLGEPVAGRPLRLRVSIDNSAGTGAVTARVFLDRVFLCRVSDSAVTSGTRGSAEWEHDAKRLKLYTRPLAEAVVCREVEAGASGAFETSELSIPEGAAATGENGLLALVEYYVRAEVGAHLFSNDVVASLMVRPGLPRPAAWGIGGDVRARAAGTAFLLDDLERGPEGGDSEEGQQQADDGEEEEEERGEGHRGTVNPLAAARASSGSKAAAKKAARSGASKY